MVSTGDLQDTQVLDTDPPSPPTDDIDLDHHSTPLGDTLPLEDLIGDTQSLEDDPDCAPAGNQDIDLWGETQVVNEYEEAAANGDGDDGEGTERTEVLSDDEGLQDDGATSCGAGNHGDELSMEDRSVGSKPCPDDKEIVAGSDSSTDEGGRGGANLSFASQLSGGSHQSYHGYIRKSFAAVRTASLRASGLTAASNITPKIIEIVPASFNNDTYSKEDNASRGQDGSNIVGLGKWPNDTSNLTSHGSRASELDLDHKCTQDYHRDETKCRVSNARVKKLFNEETPGWEETTSNADNIIGKKVPPHSAVSDYIVGGLSYVGSQEPGDQSQANALDIVDEFLLVNDMGFSQEFNAGKIDIVKSTHVSSTKGAQSLAKKIDHRSPVGKAGIFDWIDSREDEGGGEFFSKTKNVLFETRGIARKSRSQEPKARHHRSELTRDVADKNGEKEGANPKTLMKMMSLTRSDSRLTLCHAPGNEKVHKSETKTKKNLFKNMGEPSNSKSLKQQLVTTDVDGDEEGMYDVGPDAQMAAEVLETLLHGCPVSHKMEEDTHQIAGKVTENFSKGVAKKRNTSKNVSVRKRTSTSYLEGVATRSKRRKMLSDKSITGSPDLSRKHASNSRAKTSLVGTTVDKREIWKVEGHLNRSSANRNESCRSLNRDKATEAVDGIFTKDVDISREYRVNASPVAHRTRYSRAMDFLKRTETLSSEYGENKDGLTYVRTSGTLKREDRLVAEISAPVKAERKRSNIVSDPTVVVGKEIKRYNKADDIGELHEKVSKAGSKAGSPVKYSFRYPKQKRANQTTLGNSSSSGNLNSPSVAISDVLTTVQPSTQRGKSKRFVKSVSEILATAKRKKIPVSAQKASKSDGIPSDTGKLPIIYGVRTRSSVDSSSFKPALAKDSMQCSARPVLRKAGSTDAASNGSTVVMSHSVNAEEISRVNGSPKEIVQLVDAEEIAKVDGPAKEKVIISDLSCTTPSKAIDAASPVCMAQDPLTPNNKSLSRSSIIRELLRLEATEISPAWMLKDSRRRKDMTSVRVLFSHHLDEDTIKQQKKILARLGVPIASSMSEATHFVTDKFVRTRNMLEAMALGKPVVTHMWIESCGLASCFIDEKKYILRDAKKEKEIGFSMTVSLARACQFPLLQGRRVFITPNTKPNRELISSLVKAAHGQPLERIGRSALKDDKLLDDMLVISCEEDYGICKPLLEKGTEVFSSELILNGIVIQKLEYVRHRLFLDHVKQTRSTIWLRHEGGNQVLPVSRCI